MAYFPGGALSANAKTLAAAVIGGGLLELTGAPAAWLSGAIIACAACAVGGTQLHISAPLRNVAFITIGAVIGSAADSETVSQLPKWPASLAILGATLAVLLIVTPWYLTRMHKISPGTAKLASVPGALSVIIAMSETLPVDKRRIMVLQSIRITVLMFIVPLAVGAGFDAGAHAGAGADSNTAEALITWQSAALLAVCVLAAAPVAGRINFPAPFFTGPLLASAFLFGSGVVDGALPDIFVIASYVTIGAVAGARFTGVDRRYLASALPAGLGGVTVAAAVTCAAAWPTAVWLDLPFMQVWLAFAPGGFEAMTALALALDADPVFVAGHQFVRLMALFMLAPWLFKNAGKGDKRGDKTD